VVTKRENVASQFGGDSKATVVPYPDNCNRRLKKMPLPGNALLHTLRYFIGLDSANTQTTNAEQERLQHYATGCRRAVEIGVAEGVNTRSIAESLAEDGVLYAIDPFFSGRLSVCWGELIARAQVRRGGLEERVRFIQMLSWEACDKIDGTFDFVFIDGDHSLDGIRRDWADWSKKVQREGIIALHDTNIPPNESDRSKLGSHKYFQSVIQHDERFRIVEQVDSLSILQRKAQE